MEETMYELILKAIIGTGVVVSVVVIAALWAAVPADEKTKGKVK